MPILHIPRPQLTSLSYDAGMAYGICEGFPSSSLVSIIIPGREKPGVCNYVSWLRGKCPHRDHPFSRQKSNDSCI